MRVERCRFGCHDPVRGFGWELDRGQDRGCRLAGGGWTGWGRGPSLTAAHSEAALNPTPSTREVLVCRRQKSSAYVCWHAEHAPKVSATSMSLLAGSCTHPSRRQGVCFVAASECAAVSEGHGAHPLTAAAPTSQPNQRPEHISKVTQQHNQTANKK
jgi:hypothetical protein